MNESGLSMEDKAKVLNNENVDSHKDAPVVSEESLEGLDQIVADGTQPMEAPTEATQPLNAVVDVTTPVAPAPVVPVVPAASVPDAQPSVNQGYVQAGQATQSVQPQQSAPSAQPYGQPYGGPVYQPNGYAQSYGQPYVQQAYVAPNSAGEQAHDQAQVRFQAPKAQQHKVAGHKTHSSGQHTAVKTFVAGFAGSLLAFSLGVGGLIAFSENHAIQDPTQPPIVNVDGEDVTLAEAVAEQALPSVASVNIYTHEQHSPFDIFGLYGDPGSDKGALIQSSLGSGVVISDDGYILTNYHVVEGADEISVAVQDVEYTAEYIGSDPSSDIAVLKIDAEGLPAIEIGDSSSLKVGEWVMALGNPFGLENSVSTGIVSAIQRSSVMPSLDGTEMVVYPNMIQTDAAINPGNSGGALVDSEGKLIGINSLINSYSGSSSGVGFAIPIDYAMGLVEQIINGEVPTHAFLGVSMLTLNPDEAQVLETDIDYGVWVADVYSGTAADEAGFKKGDIITEFDGNEITTSEDLALVVRGYKPGDTVEVVINRNGEERTLSVELGSDEIVNAQVEDVDSGSQD